MNNMLDPLVSKTRYKVIKTGEEVVFLGFQAGGSETECNQGTLLCKNKDGTIRRFHSKELKRRIT